MSNLNAGRPSKSNQGSSLSLDDLVGLCRIKEHTLTSMVIAM